MVENGRGEPNPVQMWREVSPNPRCGRSGPSPGADVAGVSPVPHGGGSHGCGGGSDGTRGAECFGRSTGLWLESGAAGSRRLGNRGMRWIGTQRTQRIAVGIPWRLGWRWLCRSRAREGEGEQWRSGERAGARGRGGGSERAASSGGREQASSAGAVTGGSECWGVRHGSPDEAPAQVRLEVLGHVVHKVVQQPVQVRHL